MGDPGLPEARAVGVTDIGPSCLCQRVRFAARVGGRFDQIDGTRVLVRDGLARLKIRLPEGVPPEMLAALVPGHSSNGPAYPSPPTRSTGPSTTGSCRTWSPRPT